MNKWLVIALSMIAVGGQVCVGMEQEEKKPKLKIDVGDQAPTMVPVDFKKSTHKSDATPHHTSKKFFDKSDTKNRIVAQFAEDMFPGINVKKSIKKSANKRTALKLVGPKVVHRKEPSIAAWTQGLAEDTQSLSSTDSGSTDSGRTISPVREARSVPLWQGVKARTTSMGEEPKAGDISPEVQQKADDLKKQLVEYRIEQAGRLAHLDRVVASTDC